MIYAKKPTRRRNGETYRRALRRSGIQSDAYIRPMGYKADEVIGVRLHDLRDECTSRRSLSGNYIDIDRALTVGVSSWRRIDDNIDPRAGQDHGSVH